MDPLLLTGQSSAHVVNVPGENARVHRDMLADFARLRAAAAADGIDLALVSSFRDFDAQLEIFNGKARGERPIFDAEGRELDIAGLSDSALLGAILRWSALPGASRHHWGTDVDVYDRAAAPPHYRPQLLAAEYAPGGVYGNLHAWLEQHQSDYGFFRPYRTLRGGVHPEPWHLSYAPLAVPYLKAFSPEILNGALARAELALRETVLARAETLFADYVQNVDEP